MSHQERNLTTFHLISYLYEQDWKGYPDWLGYEESVWSVKRVKELLQGLIKSGIIYQWNEAVLYSFLPRKGVLSFTSNRHKQFFKNLIEASRTKEGQKVIEEYANSDSEIPPNLSNLTAVNTIEDTGEQEIQSASSKELAQLVKGNGDPLEYVAYIEILSFRIFCNYSHHLD
jgi:hypothetical protein